MTSKRLHDHDHDNGQCPDDWAGLAQNLFGINLDKTEGDDDLLDADMFKVELPKPPEPPPPPPILAPVETAPQVTEIQVATVAARIAASAVKAQPRPTTPALKAVATPKASASDELFGFGVNSEAGDDDGITLAEDFDDEGLTLASDFDDGLTLPPDFDAEGLTLPSDYDDGLTLAPEAEVDDESVDFALSATESPDDLQVDAEAADAADGTPGASKETDQAGRPRRRPRGREDAFWDLLENWEWQEIPDGDSPRGEGERSRFGRDRGPRQDRGRSEHRGRPGERRPDQRGREDRPRLEEPVRTEERTPAIDAAPRSRSSTGPQSGEESRSGDRSRSADRPRERGRPSGGRDRSSDERRREPPAPAAKKAAAPAPPPPTESNRDDFGSGIFEENSQVKGSAAAAPSRTRVPSRDVGLAQSSQGADAVLSKAQVAKQPADADGVWSEDDDSDVRLAPAGEISEATGLPAADLAGESDQTFDDTSDVVAVDDHGEGLRPRRRRRRRRRGPSDRSPSPDGGEGTMFDIHEVLGEAGSDTDLVPSAMDADSSLDDELSDNTESNAIPGNVSGEKTSERLGRRPRRRRRRPEPSVNRSEESPVARSETSIDDEVAENDSPMIEANAPVDEEEMEVATVSYAKIPRWEEAIKYLLNPQLVGRNLDPDDELESLEGDPRGSGGSEPTPPSRQHHRGGGRRRR